MHGDVCNVTSFEEPLYINNYFMCYLQATVVLREGKYHATAVERLVVGDIVSVKFGDRLPADIRIITSAGFKVNSRPNHPHIISVQ